MAGTRAGGGRRRPLLREAYARAQPVRVAFKDHRLATHAAAVAFRVLVGLVPLALLFVALLGAFGLESTWTDTIAPALRERLEPQIYAAIDFSVQQIFESAQLGLVVFASLLLLWELFRGVRAATVALNEIHDADETRSFRELVGTTLALAVAVALCLVGATLAMVVLPRATDGPLDVVLSLARWPVAVVLLGVCVALLVRYAPAERPDPRWASVGSAVVVAGWLVLSLAFGFWVTHVASYRSAVGNLAVFLVLTAYVLAASAVFLVGVEIDEVGRAKARRSGGRNGRARSS